MQVLVLVLACRHHYNCYRHIFVYFFRALLYVYCLLHYSVNKVSYYTCHTAMGIDITTIKSFKLVIHEQL